MLVLKALVRGRQHGYAVAEWIQHTSQQVLKVEEGALYPALHRLELRRLLKASWGASENHRQAKFYELTAEGRKRLSAESQQLGEAFGGGSVCDAGLLGQRNIGLYLCGCADPGTRRGSRAAGFSGS